MPVLEHAESVNVVGIDPPYATFGDDLGAALARHGVRVEVRAVPRNGRSFGGAIAAEAAIDDADLIVMGCYGHRRFARAFRRRNL